MAEKKRAKKDEQAPKERTRATNPIYQGDYTILDYDRDGEALIAYQDPGAVDESARREAYRRREEFLGRFDPLPSEERARLDAITSEVWARYDGPRSWDEPVGDMTRGSLREIPPVEYYRTMYELTDEEAITWRVGQIRDQAAKFEGWARTWAAVESAGKAEEYNGLMARRLELEAQIGFRAASDRKGTLMFWVDMLTEVLEDSEGTQADAIEWEMEFQRSVNRHLESLAGDDYGALGLDEAKKAARDCIEELLPKDVFEARYRHPGGYEDAVARIYRDALSPTVWTGEDPRDLLKHPDLKKALEGSVSRAVEWLDRMERRPMKDGRAARTGQAITTQAMAKRNPFMPPKLYMVPRDHASDIIGTLKTLKAYSDDRNVLEFDPYYRRESPGRAEILNHITIRGCNGKIVTKKVLALSAVIGTLYWDKNKKHIDRGEPHEQVRVSENELLRLLYGKSDKECTQKQQDELSELMFYSMGLVVEIDASPLFRAYPETNDRLRQIWPEIPEEQRLTGRFYRNELYTDVVPETEDVHTGRKTKWFDIKGMPMTMIYPWITGQWEKADKSLRETPKIAERDLSSDAAELLDRLSAGKIDLWSGKEGGRYLYLSNTRELDVLMYVILSWIERMTADPTTKWNVKGEVDMDLDKIRAEIWSGEYDNKTKGRQKQYIIKYLVYLVNNPKSKISNIEVLSGGRSRMKTARLYLKREGRKAIGAEGGASGPR
jgi:hypothetical protein